MKLSIMMLALESRPWQAMAAEITRQIAPFLDDVEFLVELDEGSRTSGVKRQAVSRRARGDYVCFVDDDDWVSDDYVSSVLNGCLTGADVVTFHLRLHHYNGGVDVWKFGLHEDTRSFGRMTANHLCAWKRDIATLVGWCPQVGFGDDQLWYKPLFHSGLVKSEHAINRVLYEYKFDPRSSAQQRENVKMLSRKYVGAGLRCFISGDKILVEVGNRPMPPDIVCVRDRLNEEFLVPAEALRHYYTVQLG